MSENTQQSLTNKITMWLLGSLASLASYAAVVQNKRVTDLQESWKSEKEYYQKQLGAKDVIIAWERKQKDSLQAVIVTRSDRSLEDWKEMLDLNKHNNTITIKPKKK